MKAKTIFTVVILAFVAVSVGYLVVKEVRRTRAPEVAAEERGSGSGETERSIAPATGVHGGEAPEAGTTPAASDRKVIVTYYYTSKR